MGSCSHHPHLCPPPPSPPSPCCQPSLDVNYHSVITFCCSVCRCCTCAYLEQKPNVLDFSNPFPRAVHAEQSILSGCCFRSSLQQRGLLCAPPHPRDGLRAHLWLDAHTGRCMPLAPRGSNPLLEPFAKLLICSFGEWPKKNFPIFCRIAGEGAGQLRSPREARCGLARGASTEAGC